MVEDADAPAAAVPAVVPVHHLELGVVGPPTGHRHIQIYPPLLKTCRNICGLGCVTRARSRALACAQFTQPSPHIFLLVYSLKGLSSLPRLCESH